MTLLELLADNAWKGTVILGAAMAAAAILRRSPAALRHLVWTATFAALLALPVLTLELPRSVSLPVLEVPATETAIVVHATPAPKPSHPWSAVLLFWLSGFTATAAWFLLGAARTSRMVRRSVAAPYARKPLIRRRVRVLESPDTRTPLTWGILRPVVLLPPDAARWPAGRLDTVLLHELVHVRRIDVLWQAIAQAACCLYWFHPAAWYALRQLRKERECACDDAVLLGGIAAHEYAGYLMELVRDVARQRATLAGAPGMAEASDFESRIRALLDQGRRRGPVSRRAALAVTAAAFAVILPMASVTARAQARGALAGTVEDASGARVPRCEVTATNLDGANREVTRSNSAGEYAFASIPPGRYTLEFRMPGFAVFKAETVVVAGAPARLDGKLDVGRVSETMVVKGQRSAPAAIPASRAPERIRVGGNVQATRLITQVRPEYPADLQSAGIQGTVVLRAVISTTGDPLNLEALSTAVHPGLVKAALDAVRQWRYQPTLLNGQPVEVATTITIEFTLE